MRDGNDLIKDVIIFVLILQSKSIILLLDKFKCCNPVDFKIKLLKKSALPVVNAESIE